MTTYFARTTFAVRADISDQSEPSSTITVLECEELFGGRRVGNEMLGNGVGWSKTHPVVGSRLPPEHHFNLN